MRSGIEYSAATQARLCNMPLLAWTLQLKCVSRRRGNASAETTFLRQCRAHRGGVMADEAARAKRFPRLCRCHDPQKKLTELLKKNVELWGKDPNRFLFCRCPICVQKAIWFLSILFCEAEVGSAWAAIKLGPERTQIARAQCSSSHVRPRWRSC